MEFTAKQLAEYILRLPEKEQNYLVKFPFTVPTGSVILLPVEKIEPDHIRASVILN